MKLIKTREQPPVAGLAARHREWWDLGDGYEIYVDIGKTECAIGVDGPNKKDLTYEVAKILNVDVSEAKLIKRHTGDEELFASLGIDCVVLNYRHPEKYKELLLKIEEVVNKHFKAKSA